MTQTLSLTLSLTVPPTLLSLTAPQVFLTMHRGDALERGAELAVFLIDAPQVHHPNPSPSPDPDPETLPLKP